MIAALITLVATHSRLEGAIPWSGNVNACCASLGRHENHIDHEVFAAFIPRIVDVVTRIHKRAALRVNDARAGGIISLIVGEVAGSNHHPDGPTMLVPASLAARHKGYFGDGDPGSISVYNAGRRLKLCPNWIR